MGTVLVLDDRPEDRQLMSTLLSYAGHAVIEAASGELALELARDQRPQLIITDIVMPGMNGYEFVRRLREDSVIGATQVIFCTANYLEGEVRELAAACGVSRFIRKPSPPEVVLATVAETLGENPPQLPPQAPGPDFEREQLRVINDKLVEKVTELERVSAQRQRLLGLIIGAQEEERQRIADGIHDDSLQTVVAVGLWLDQVRRRVDDPDLIKTLDRSRETVRLAGRRLRSLLFELRPVELDAHGLVHGLRGYLEYAQREEGLDFTIDDRLGSEPESAARVFLYRVTQEILMNVRKHARASNVELTLMSRDGTIVIRVRDDGIGFDAVDALRVRPGHLGLAALIERLQLAGGALRIDSTPGAGTTVEFETPAAFTPPG